jgi:uncharacterized protein YhbP (UPF0306 family)
MPDHERADARLAKRLRLERDLVDPLGTLARRLEVEENVVRLRPERGGARRQVRPHPFEGLQRLCQPDELRQPFREHAADGRVVTVPVLARVDPLLGRCPAPDAERSRAWERLLDQVSLHALHRFEVVGLRVLGVDLERDARPIAQEQPETRADADFEGEAVDCLRAQLAHLRPDLAWIAGAEDRSLDLRVGPEPFRDEIRQLRASIIRGHDRRLRRLRGRPQDLGLGGEPELQAHRLAVRGSGRRVRAQRLETTARRLLDASTLCAIATASPRNRPYVNTAYFAWSPEFDLYWLSEPAAQHSHNIRANGGAAIAVFDSTQSWGGSDRGLQLFGTASELAGRSARAAEELYARRFPDYDQPALPSYRFYRLAPRRMKLFDERVFGAAVFVIAAVHGGRLTWARTEVYR